LLLDEMQWADVASWDVLEHVCHQLDNERLVIALTFRTEPAYAEAAERRQSLTRNAVYRELTLPRLTRDEAKRWLEGAMHGQEVGRELLAFIYRHTEGNPLFIAQLLRTLVEEGALWQGEGRWQWTPVSELRLPIGLSALIGRRLSRLSSSTQAVLSIAAVIGDEFDVGFVVEAGAGSQAAVQLALSEGLAAGLLRSSYERGGRGYAFTHAHTVDALLQSIPHDRLRAIEQRVAEAIERRDQSRVAEIALHYDAAGTSGPAYLHALIAAEHAERVYAYAAANGFLHVAARNVSSPAELAEVRVRLATLAEITGRFDEAEELCDLAIEWFEAHGDSHRSLPLRCMRERARKELGQPAKLTLEALLALDAEAHQLGLARERVDILLMLSQTYGRLGDVKESVRIATTCVHNAESIDDQMLLAQALNRLAVTLHHQEPDKAEENYRRALDIFQRIGDVRGQARCYSNLGGIAAARNAWQKARESYSTAIALARSGGMPDLWGTAATNLGLTYHRSGDFERARELHGQALALVAAVKNSEIQLYALYNMAHLEFETRAWESGAELYEATASLAQRIGADDVEIGAMAGVGLCKTEEGELDAARAAYQVVEERVRRRQDWFQGRELVEALHILLLSVENRFDEAINRLEDVLPEAEASEFYTAAWLIAVCGRTLHPVRPDRVALLLERYASQVQEYGYYEISKQLNNLRIR
jgi:tetratricopeptide (TPR) repeat protein